MNCNLPYPYQSFLKSFSFFLIADGILQGFSKKTKSSVVFRSRLGSLCNNISCCFTRAGHFVTTTNGTSSITLLLLASFLYDGQNLFEDIVNICVNKFFDKVYRILFKGNIHCCF